MLSSRSILMRTSGCLHLLLNTQNRCLTNGSFVQPIKHTSSNNTASGAAKEENYNKCQDKEMKTYLYLGIVFAFAVSALAIPSRHARGIYYTPDYCCPKIVPALGGIPHSVIEPTYDCSLNVAIITDWGNCSVADTGFWWLVDWHDGTYDEGCTDDLGPFDPLTHQYSGCNDYYKKGHKGMEVCVTIYYCSSIDSKFRYCSHNANCCDAIDKCVTVY